MARLELIGGAYSARSVIANAQRCLNLYPEKNRVDSPTKFTFYQRPGLRKLSSPPNPGLGRSVLRASNGDGYAVVGQTVYTLDANFAWTQIGQLQAARTNPVSLSDNGQQVVLGDGSDIGYSWTLNDPSTFAPINDPTGTFTGTVKWDVILGYLLWVFPSSQLFGSTLDNELVFDATYFGSKNGYPDPLVTLLVNRQIIILFGEVKSEIWTYSGGALFPFSIQPGAYIEWGCQAPYTVANIGITVFWLATGTQGTGLILQQEGYVTSIISNHAISFAISEMLKAGININDAVAYTYTQDGHIFYVITFVSGNQTWVYDYSVRDPEYAWHQRGWTSPLDGTVNQERAFSAAFLYNTNVTMDWQNGDLYALDLDYFFDDVKELAGPVQYTRTFSQVTKGHLSGRGPKGFQNFLIDIDTGEGVITHKFVADFECGNGPVGTEGLPASISLRWSTDRGRTWLASVLQSTGNPGEYSAQPKWEPLGYARYPLFELSWSFGGKAALNGAWFEPQLTTQ